MFTARGESLIGTKNQSYSHTGWWTVVVGSNHHSGIKPPRNCFPLKPRTQEAKVCKYTGLIVNFSQLFANTCNFYSNATQHSKYPSYITEKNQTWCHECLKLNNKDTIALTPSVTRDWMEIYSSKIYTLGLLKINKTNTWSVTSRKVQFQSGLS